MIYFIENYKAIINMLQRRQFIEFLDNERIEILENLIKEIKKIKRKEKWNKFKIRF